MTWDPESYPTTIRTEVHDYEELQDRVAQATRGVHASTILDLGVGTGETARRVLALHPEARLVGIDSSAAMLRGARQALPAQRVSLLEGDLAAPLPDATFDLVVSALAVHHLEGAAKGELFARVARRLRPGGRLVIGDVVVPDDPAASVIENEPGYDFPSPVADQLEWLEAAGLAAEVVWSAGDLAVLRADLP